MNEQLVQATVDFLRAKSTEELLRLYDKAEHSVEGVEALRQVLRERHVALPTPRQQRREPLSASQGLIDDAVPWTSHDVWVGVASLGLLGIMVSFLPLPLNIGMLVSVTEFLSVLPIWYLTVWQYKVKWDTLGLRKFTGAAIGLGVGLLFRFYVFSFVYSGLLLFLFDRRIQEDLMPHLVTLSSPWWLVIGGVIVAPVVEEIGFRGFIFGGLRPRYGWRKAACISAALFAALHLQWTALPPLFVLGYLLAYVYQQSNSIWPAILMHGLNNALVLGGAYLVAKTGIPR